jgi:hypothetical protein
MSQRIESVSMRLRRIQTRLINWIAVLAILMASFGPSLGHVLGFAKGTVLFEVCTAQGAKWIAAGEDTKSPTPRVNHVLAHCLFCTGHAPALGLPPSSEHVVLSIGVRDELPPLFYVASGKQQHPWLKAQPRAPPRRA